MQSLNPITKGYPLNGLRNIFRGVFKLLAIREQAKPDLAFLMTIIERPANYQSEAYNLFLEVLELR